jgi:CHASE2 domain-containing sensor protein
VQGPVVALHNRLCRTLGALPPRKIIWGLVIVFSSWILIDVLVLKVTSDQSHASFDAMVRSRLYTAPPDPRIVVIDIDEASLQRMAGEFGRWPWPRDTLATVLDYVEQQQPAAVVWDIVFSDADRISPGGDAAFDAAVKRSRHSVFPVVRLPASADADSALSNAVLPGLWAAPGTADTGATTATAALIPPALPAVAAAPLGYNNGYVDEDGVLRRYRAFETLRDGSRIRSVAMTTLSLVNPPAYARALATPDGDALIAWRQTARAYPRVSFADVFEKADGGTPGQDLPQFAGKVVLIGSTASSLHDIHPTPLSAEQPGINSLATVIDNALNERRIAELPRWLSALLAIALCVALGLWVQENKFSRLLPMTFAVPIALLLFSYGTLNGSPLFLDLNLSAGLALVFLTLLRFWNQLRRAYWCSVPEPQTTDTGEWALWPLVHDSTWSDVPLDRLIDLVSKHVPDCRLMAPDLNSLPLHRLRWPELARYAAVAGPQASVLRATTQLQPALAALGVRSGKMVPQKPGATRLDLVGSAVTAWAAMHGIVDSN